jgi:hypothetical protein
MIKKSKSYTIKNSFTQIAEAERRHRMESTLKMIGFARADEDEEIEKIISEVLDKPTYQVATKVIKNQIVAEYAKEVAQDTYIVARVTVDKANKKSAIEVQQCEGHVISQFDLEVEEVEIECIDDENTYYVICEEVETNMQLIFWLQNVVDYLEAKHKKKTCKKINVVALAQEGTIILPILKDEEEENYEREERDKLKTILQKMKEGDEEARIQLEEEEKELDNQLKQRLREEDFLSIMSGYFIPTTLEDAMYAILGEITAIRTTKNKLTGEKLFVFTLDVNDMPLEVMICADTLVGMPAVGMRFMGTAWLQGKVVME